MKRIMLLTGSRLTANPIEIHNLLKIVRPDCIPDFLKFSNRFCDPVQLKEGVEFRGPSFNQELELLYRKRFAYRRERDNERVLLDMKKIQRQKIETFGNTVIVDKIRNLILDSDFQKFEEENPDVSVF